MGRVRLDCLMMAGYCLPGVVADAIYLLLIFVVAQRVAPRFCKLKGMFDMACTIICVKNGKSELRRYCHTLAACSRLR